jgi:hypothetical protein
MNRKGIFGLVIKLLVSLGFQRQGQGLLDTGTRETTISIYSS